MNTIPSESDSNAILDRLLSGAGLHRDAQLAALLGVSPQAVSQAQGRMSRIWTWTRTRMYVNR